MKNVLFFAITVIVIVLASCNTTQKTAIPFNTSLQLDDTYTIIWNGISRAYRYEAGQWTRAENYDYQFDVVQKRYENRWKSVKSLHRIHPNYDGKAGERDQTMYFDIDYKNLNRGEVQSNITASVGNGNGICDAEFRKIVLIMYVQNPGMFMPYNKYRITQLYNYEEGILTETVELIKEKDGKETPFMKNEETAFIFIKGKLNRAPTIFKQ